MTHFRITKKWRKRGNILRAIIHGTLGNNAFFASEHDKIHDNGGQEEPKDDKKHSFIFQKVDFLPSLVRVPSRGFNRLRKVVSMRKHEVQEGDGSDELCKKRIIMGKKCRPLNVSGALHYDKNGVLVPEDLFSSSNDSLV